MNPNLAKLLLDILDTILASQSSNEDIIALKQKIAESEIDLNEALEKYNAVRNSDQPFTDDDVRDILSGI